jgi:hypothetical protein
VRKGKPAPAVVDTNVPVVANGRDPRRLSCVAACAKALYAITRAGLLVIDEGGLIFDEYKRHLSFSGRPGAGDYFFKWLSDNRYKPNRVALVRLAEDPDRPGEFAAFPTDPRLARFDRSDRKFVAAALSHPARPTALNAVDRDWWDHREALRRNGVKVRFVCGEEVFRQRHRRST